MRIEGSDALDYDKVIEKGFSLIENEKTATFGLLCICGVNFGLRISDLLGITYDQLKSGEFIIREQKTGKRRKVVCNDVVKKAVIEVAKHGFVNYSLGGMAFFSQKGSVYSPQHVNRLLKKYFSEKSKKISSHSLRKGFGKRYYDKFGGIAGVTKLQMQFNHSSPQTTLAYIGVTQDELDNMYTDIL